jgi:N-acetylglucosamine kinase-like BadF-type ATPase
MTMDDIIGKFLDDEALLDGGGVACRAVVAELSREGVTVHTSSVANVQTVLRRVLAVQRERVVANA